MEYTPEERGERIIQACGIVNDHSDACPCYHAINAQYPTVRKRRYLERP